MRPYLYLPILCSLTLSPAYANEPFSKVGWEKAYARRDFKLGITLDEFRAIPFPDKINSQRTGPDTKVYVMCSNDSEVSGADYVEAQANYKDRGLGILKCMHFYNWESGSTFAAQLMMGSEWHLPTAFYFVQPEGQEDYYLFKIESSPSSYGYAGLVNAFTAAFGKRPSVRQQAVQNGFGAQYVNSVATWDNGVSQVRMEKYYVDLKDAMVTYTLKPLAKIVEQRQGASNPL